MTVTQGPRVERPPHAGKTDCDRGRHDWKYLYEDRHGMHYECPCCDAKDSD